MPTKRRKIEVHKMKISGLDEGQSYGTLIRDVRRRINLLRDAIMQHASKSHALYEVSIHNRRLHLRFLSFATGYRPDVLDTQDFDVEENPLEDHQTGVEWTHVLGGRVGARYLLLVEKFQVGIWPTTVERYLQWMIDEHYVPDDDDADPLVVSIEAEPSATFVNKIDEMTRVTKATVRTVRPNPGWADLESELADMSDESDARKAEVSLTARRRASLDKDAGILAAIKRLFRQRELDYAAVEGEHDGKKERFSTERLGEFRYVNLRLDENGQVDHDDAWRKLNAMMDDLQ
jgi:hypothetical protein